MNPINDEFPKKLSDLVGEQISSINFVMDYFEVHLNGNVLRILGESELKCGGSLFKFPQVGSRDALCQLIGSEVVSVMFEKERTFSIMMSNDCVLVVELGNETESLHFIPNGPLPSGVGPMQIFY